MPSPASLGWAAALASLGQAAPGILDRYKEDLEAQAKKAKEKRLNASLTALLEGMPEYGGGGGEASQPVDPNPIPQASGGPGGALDALALPPAPPTAPPLGSLQGVRGLDALRLRMPQNVPDPAMPEGGALGALTRPEEPNAITALDTEADKRPEYAHDGQGKRISKPSHVADDYLRRWKAASRESDEYLRRWKAAKFGKDTGSALLSDMAAAPPKRMETLPRKVTRGDQVQYLLSKVKDPALMPKVLSLLTPFMDMAKAERDAEKEKQAASEKQLDREHDNARDKARLDFERWKVGNDQDHTRQTESLGALRAQRQSLQQQLQDLRSFQKRVADGKETPEMLSAAYPDFYTQHFQDEGKWDQFLRGSGAKAPKEIKFNQQYFSQVLNALQSNIQAIDQALASQSGAPFFAPPPSEASNPLSKYLTPKAP